MLKRILVTIGIIIIALLVIVLMFGVQPQIWISKVMISILLFIFGMVIFLKYKDNFKDKKKLVANIILVQVEVVIVFMIFLTLININANVHVLERNGKKFVMSVDVNNDIKKYFLYINPLFISRDAAIEEYMNRSSTNYSYEQDIPDVIKFNKRVFPDEVDLYGIESTKRIVECNGLNADERIVEYLKSEDDMNAFEEKYNLTLDEYDKDFFIDQEIIAVSYEVLKEVIPFVAYGVDDNIYIYIKDDEQAEASTTAFAFIIMDKQQAQNIYIKDFDSILKNNYV